MVRVISFTETSVLSKINTISLDIIFNQESYLAAY